MSSSEEKSRLGRVCVLGLGKTGTQVASYLVSLGSPRVESVTLYGGAASRPSEATEALAAAGVRVVLATDELEGHYDLAIVSPGIPEKSAFFLSALDHASELVGEPEFAWRESPRDWVAITGTNGKTTTTTLMTALLNDAGMDAVAVGNIGNLATGEVPGRPAGEWFVAELSSFQLATASTLSPRAACLLNLTPDHVEWHGSLEAYAAAKERVFQNMGAHDLAVVSVDDDWCRAVAQRLEEKNVRCALVSVAAEPVSPCAAFVRDGRLVVRLDGEEHVLLAREEMSLAGTHNVQNALCAATMALELGVSAESVNQTLRSFHALAHRIEPAGEVAGVRYVNDSKATNTDAVEKALTAFPAGRTVVLLGGHDKGTDLTSLASAVAAGCKTAVCYGEAGERIACAVESAAESSGSSVAVVRAPHMREAFDAARAAAAEGDTVLLSPACSSFDEFANMAERGNLFKQLVADLINEGEKN